MSDALYDNINMDDMKSQLGHPAKEEEVIIKEAIADELEEEVLDAEMITGEKIHAELDGKPVIEKTDLQENAEFMEEVQVEEAELISVNNEAMKRSGEARFDINFEDDKALNLDSVMN